MAADPLLINQFREDGFVVFEGVIGEREIAAMRDAASRFFVNGASHMFTRDYLRYPVLASLPFRPAIAANLRKVLGQEYATITQFSVTANLHSPVWHRDSQSAGEREYLWDDDYRIGKCGVYLQDNDCEWGGGMEVVRGSHRPGWLGHRTPLGHSNPLAKVARLLQRTARNARDRISEHLWLPLRAGDVILFHANLVHRASQPARAVMTRDRHRLVDPPRDKLKFMIQWEVSANNRYLPVYLAHQAGRAATETRKLYEESLNARFPVDYDPQLVAHIRASGLNVANYSDVATGTAERLPS